MDNTQVMAYFKTTKIFAFLQDEISDVTYNGNALYAETIKGIKTQVKILFTQQDAFEFVKRIADLSGKNFNYAAPILDLAFARYRLNAIHPSIAQTADKQVVNFSIRISSLHNRIDETNNEYAPSSVFKLLKKIIDHEQSLLIGGITGSGKSELQRYLIEQIDPDKRIIILQDSAEMMPISCLNASLWLYQGEDIKRLDALFKAGLRSNPDWLMLSEIRGKEAKIMLQALTTGTAMITTIHSRHVLDIKNRFLSLLELSRKEDWMQAKKELANYIQFYVLVEKKKMKQGLKRRIGGISLLYLYEGVVYERLLYEAKNQQITYAELPQHIADSIKTRKDWFDEENT